MLKQVLAFGAAVVFSLSGCSQESGNISSQQSDSSPEAYSFEKTSENQGILYVSMDDFQNAQNELNAIIQESGRSASIKAEPNGENILLTMEGNFEGLFEENANSKVELAKSVSFTKHDYCIKYWFIWDWNITRYKEFQAYTDAKAAVVYTLFLATPGLRYASWYEGSCPG